MKRTIVQEGRKTKTEDGETPSGGVTPVAQEPLEKLQTIGEERRTSAGDLEKGLNGSEDETVGDAKGEKDEAEGESIPVVKKTDSS